MNFIEKLTNDASQIVNHYKDITKAITAKGVTSSGKLKNFAKEISQIQTTVINNVGGEGEIEKIIKSKVEFAPPLDRLAEDLEFWRAVGISFNYNPILTSSPRVVGNERYIDINLKYGEAKVTIQDTWFSNEVIEKTITKGKTTIKLKDATSKLNHSVSLRADLTKDGTKYETVISHAYFEMTDDNAIIS